MLLRKHGHGMELCISASILNADLSNLSELARRIEAFGADWIHFDVMDGVFVENISFGLPILRAMRQCTKLPLDVHLMIQNPLRYVQAFADAGADWLTIHAESDGDTAETLSHIRACGLKAGLSLRPGTSTEVLKPYLDQLDLILMMSVEPGFGGQAFLPETLPRLETVRAMLGERSVRLAVDGGIDGNTGSLVRNAGADVLVAGSYLFKAQDSQEAVRRLRGIDGTAL